MSGTTTTPETDESRPAAAGPDAPELQDEFIQREIDRARFQVWVVDLCSSVAWILVAIVGFLLLMVAVDHWVIGLSMWGRLAALVVLLLGVAALAVWRLVPVLTRPVNPIFAAHAIEHVSPGLKNGLINFLLIRSHPEGVRPIVLDGVRRQAADGLQQVDLDTAVDRSHLIRVGYVLAALVALAGAYKILSPKDPFQSVARVTMPWQPIDRPSRVLVTNIAPGDTEIYRGQVVSVSAEVTGQSDDEPVELVYRTAQGQVVDQVVLMTRPADGGRYSGEIRPGETGIQHSIFYFVRAGDGRSRDFQIQVLDAPSISLEAIEYRYPAYTEMPTERISGDGDLRAIEGTQVEIYAAANQPIRDAYLELFDADDATSPADVKPSQALPMKVTGQDAVGQLTMLLKPNGEGPLFGAYQIRFTNRQGARNEQPARYRIEVARDLAPTIEILEPAQRDIDWPANQVLPLKLRARDPDFRLQQVILRGKQKSVELLHQPLLSETQIGPVVLEPQLDPRKLGLKAGDELVFWAEATDNRMAPIGNVAAPNLVRTEDYRLRLVAPEKPTRGPDGEPEAGDEGDTDAGAEQPSDSADTDSGGGEGQAGEQSDASTSDESEGSSGEGSGAAADPSEPSDPGDDSQDSSSGGAESSPSGQGPKPADDPSTGSDSESGDGGKSTAGSADRNPASEATPGSQPSPEGGEAQEPVASDGSNDSEAFDRILEHMQGRDDTPGTPANEERPDSTQESPTPGDDGDRSDGTRDSATDDAADPAAADRSNDGAATGEEADTPERPAPGRTPQAGRTPGEKADDGSPPADRSGNGSPTPSQQTDDTENTDDASSTDRSQQPSNDGSANANDDDDASGQVGDGQSQETKSPSSTPSSDGTPEPSDEQPTETPNGQGTAATDDQDARESTDASPADQPADPSSEPPRPVGGQPGRGAQTESELPGGDSVQDEANLEYARKATDLALEYLEHAEDDQELLDRLGWTQEEMASFLERWKGLRERATQPGPDQPRAGDDLKDQLRSLGLRPPTAARRTLQGPADRIDRLRQDGAITSPPAEYRDLYRAYLKSVPRPTSDDE